MINIGRLERLPLRDVWPHEALDFTTWLEKNPEVLEEVLAFSVASVQREQVAGAFSVDLVAEDEEGNVVVIENQLEKSDHDHLGKLLTYLTALEAKTAVWIVADARPEHVRAITWLNESSSASFYMVLAEAVRIDNSPPAALLTRIVGPSAEARHAGATKQELAEGHVLRIEFWKELLERARARTSLHASVSPTKQNWISAGTSMSGLSLNYVIRQRDGRVELYIDRGADKEEGNKAIFDQLEAQRDQIEERFGASLTWQRLEARRACRISYPIAIGGYRDQHVWPELQEKMIDAMIRFEKALEPAIRDLHI